MFQLVSHLFLVLFSLNGLNSYLTGEIEANEKLIFFPTIATEFNSTHWNVPVHGWIFEPKNESIKRAAFLSLLQKALDVSEQSEVSFLKRRVRPFVVDNQSLKRPRISLGGIVHRLPLSKKNGHFETNLVLPMKRIQQFAQTKKGDNNNNNNDNGLQFLRFRAVTGENDNRIFEGVVHVVPPKGVSIISDIDDTIKITGVFTGKRSLLENTFLKEFIPVPGMAKVYHEWKEHFRGESHVTFHYVSSSVYQLYEDLESFRHDYGFPPATFHLKTIRPKNLHKTLSTLGADPQKTKKVKIETIMRRLPSRSFILVGDSGEKDPEVYSDIAKRYPAQVMAVFIRNVNNSTDASRFKGLSDDKWSFFDNAVDLTEKSNRLLSL